MIKKPKPENFNPIAQVLDKVNSRYLIQNKFAQLEIEQIWPLVVGTVIAKNTLNIRVVKDVLYVSFDNAIIKNEMFNRRLQLIESVNNHLGRQKVKKIFIS